MTEYKTSEGKYGLTYMIAEGVNVVTTQYSTYQLVIVHQGRRKKSSFGGGEDGLKMALDAAERMAAKLGLGKRAATDQLVTVSQVATEWMETNRGRWSPSTKERYGGVVRDFIEPVIGKHPIKRVTRSNVKDLLANALDRCSPKSVEIIHAVISGIFGEAIDRGYTEENPASGLLKKILPPKNKRNQSDPDPLTRDDLGKLLEAVWRVLPYPVPLVIETMAYTGMRLGEALAMHVDHLDIAGATYRVSESVKYGVYGLPKTGKRVIDVPPSLVEKLKLHIVKCRRELLSEGKDVEYFFPQVTHRIVQGALKRACRAAKLRVRNPHDLRHTYATILLMDHWSPAYVQKQLGHHSITMTVDIYGHWIPGEGKRDLDQVLGSSTGDAKKSTSKGSEPKVVKLR